jgi:hypothetical protein
LSQTQNNQISQETSPHARFRIPKTAIQAERNCVLIRSTQGERNRRPRMTRQVVQNFEPTGSNLIEHNRAQTKLNRDKPCQRLRTAIPYERSSGVTATTLAEGSREQTLTSLDEKSSSGKLLSQSSCTLVQRASNPNEIRQRLKSSTLNVHSF